MKRKLTMLLFVVLFVVLVHNVMQMPSVSSTDAPSYNETANYYIEHSVEETGAVNIVAAILTDYRAFDTLGETIVLFTSIVAVVSILRATKTDEEASVSKDE